MQRAAIYARYSSDLQSERSIDDQITLCRAPVIQDGNEVVEIYSDAAKSGASIFGREGLLQLMADSSREKFDIVYVEAFDRLAREMSELMDLRRRLEFKNIRIKTIQDGDGNTINTALRGLFAQLAREDIAFKTRRGLAGRVRDGQSAGGVSYGYRADPMNRGSLLIREDEANVVRRIFREYSEGKSPRAIAAQLNEEGVPGPRGNVWSAGTLNGSATRKNGVLHNQLYIGVRVWNRNRFVKDPDTGKRISRLNPESEWQHISVPELALIPQDQWDAAQTLRERRLETFDERRGTRRPKRLFSGLLKCGSCGSGLVVGGKDKVGYRIRCSAHAQSGTCPDPKTFYLSTVEDLVLGTLLKELRAPDNLKLYVETYQAEMRWLVQERTAQKVTAESDLEKIMSQMHKIVDKMLDDSIPDQVAKPRMEELKKKREAAIAATKSVPEIPKVVTMLPATVTRYADAIRSLQAAIQDARVDPSGDDAKFLRELVEKVIVFRDDKTDRVKIEVHGHLNVLMHENAGNAVEGISGCGDLLKSEVADTKKPPGWGGWCARWSIAI